MTDKAANPEATISALLEEQRKFPPTDEFTRHANANDPGVYDRAAKDPESFWAGWAEELDWHTKWSRVLEWNPPYAKWFVGGTLNASYNCLDRQLANRGEKKALIWEGEPGDSRTMTYRELHEEVSQLANVLKKLGVGQGDLHPIHEVAPARLPLPRGAEAEQVPEEVREIPEARRIEAPEAPARRAREGGASIPVVSRALLRVGEYGVRLRGLLELLLRLRSSRVPVRVVLQGKPPVRGLQLRTVGVARDTEHLVVVAPARHESPLTAWGRGAARGSRAREHDPRQDLRDTLHVEEGLDERVAGVARRHFP